MTSIKSVAVIGATGMLGLPVTSALMEEGFSVTALARYPARARAALPAAVSVLEADIRDEESLRRGLSGHDALYLSLAVSPGEPRTGFHTEAQGMQNILAAAKDAGIARLAYVSALIHDARSDWWVLDVWRGALERIKASGIPYTIFYPTNFMETLAERHVVGRTLITLGRSHYPNYWIAGSDYGRQVARSFALPQAANREYYVQGPEPLTYDVAARIYAKAQGRSPFFFVQIPMPLARALALTSRELEYHARIMSTVLAYPEEFKAGDTWDELGRPKTTLAQFAAQLAARNEA